MMASTRKLPVILAAHRPDEENSTGGIQAFPTSSFLRVSSVYDFQDMGDE
jgi:hypothetical protein